MKRILLLVLVAGLGLFGLSAQTGQTAVLAYFTGDVQVTDQDGFTYPVKLGDSVNSGWTIKTRNGTAELRLVPNGTIIRLANNTNFSIDSLQGVNSAGSNDFTVGQGRVRTVAARSPGAAYNFRTATAVGGVRGTDFGIDVIPGSRDALFVKNGQVEFTNLATGGKVTLNAGQIADTFASVFQPVTLSPDQLADLFSDLSFDVLDPEEVPSQPVSDEQSNDGDSTAANNGESGDGGGAGDNSGGSGAQEPASPSGNPVVDEVLKFLGLEVGSVTINGQTYSKAVLQPKFSFGDFRTQLYLPVVYTNDLFDPDDWYRPDGNDEWSFGTDQGSDALAIVSDVLRDLVLKFKYIEIGNYRDPFFLKLGNIESMTLGHGILINGYANDADFPAVRRVGLNIGIGGEKDPAGIELLVNDLAQPEIFGARFVVRPAAPDFGFGIAISAAADINPTRDFKRAIDDGFALNALQVAAAEADPIFLNFAFDLDLPIITSDIADLVFFTDFGFMMPIIQRSVTYGGTQVSSGFRADAFIHNLELDNFGVQAGFFGNVLILDYRLEFQYYRGGFIPNFYNQPYDRIRGDRALAVMANLADPELFKGVSTMGIYGSGEVNLFDLVSINLGYKWPWLIGADGLDITADDYFHIGFQIPKGALPLGLSGGVQYDRVKFRNVFWDDNFQIFDENATLKGNVAIEVSPILDLVVTVGTSVLRDSNGVVQYDANGRPKFGPTVSIETKIGLE